MSENIITLKCPECGASLDRYQIECAYCGAKISWEKKPAKEQYENIAETITEMTKSAMSAVKETRDYPDYTKPKRKKSSKTPMIVGIVIMGILLGTLVNGNLLNGFIDMEKTPKPIDVAFYAQTHVVVVRTLIAETFDLPYSALTNVGLEYIRGLLQQGVNTTQSPFDYIAIGEGHSSMPANADALVLECSRLQGLVEQIAFNAYQVRVTFPSGIFDGQEVQEIGLFNTDVGGILLYYQTFTSITLYSGDSLTIDVIVTLGD